MFKCYKLWAFLSTVLGAGALFQLGCGLNKSTALLLAILQEDIFS